MGAGGESGRLVRNAGSILPANPEFATTADCELLLSFNWGEGRLRQSLTLQFRLHLELRAILLFSASRVMGLQVHPTLQLEDWELKESEILPPTRSATAF